MAKWTVKVQRDETGFHGRLRHGKEGSLALAGDSYTDLFLNAAAIIEAEEEPKEEDYHFVVDDDWFTDKEM